MQYAQDCFNYPEHVQITVCLTYSGLNSFSVSDPGLQAVVLRQLKLNDTAPYQQGLTDAELAKCIYLTQQLSPAVTGFNAHTYLQIDGRVRASEFMHLFATVSERRSDRLMLIAHHRS